MKFSIFFLNSKTDNRGPAIFKLSKVFYHWLNISILSRKARMFNALNILVIVYFKAINVDNQ